MPTYEYDCLNCSKKHTQFQKISDKPLTLCPHCHTDSLKRGPGGGFGVTFQGSGFYATDYQKQDAAPAPPPEKKSCCPCSGKHTCGS